MGSYGGWPAPVRAMAETIEAAVQAARDGAQLPFDEALGTLARVDPAPVAVVLGEVARRLVELAFPDGPDAGDAEELIGRCVTRFRWYAPIDEAVLVHALTDALDVSLPEERTPERATVAHGLLLITELLGGSPLGPVLDTALRELQRQQTVELP